MTDATTIEHFPVRNRWTGAVQFTAEIAVTPDMTTGAKIGLAVRWGVENGANLSRADLSDAVLSGAVLSGAVLSRANLSRANLSRADLSGAVLSRANLSGADLSRADLSRADLSRAYLSRAVLSDAVLSGAVLSDAVLSRAKNFKLPHFQLPDGDLIVWKAISTGLCKLLVPADAKRTASVVGRKCRAEFVKVLEGEGYDKHTGKTHYKPGEIVRPDSYDDSPLVECTNGIHFFCTKAEAEEWL